MKKVLLLLVLGIATISCTKNDDEIISTIPIDIPVDTATVISIDRIVRINIKSDSHQGKLGGITKSIYINGIWFNTYQGSNSNNISVPCKVDDVIKIKMGFSVPSDFNYSSLIYISINNLSHYYNYMTTSSGDRWNNIEASYIVI